MNSPSQMQRRTGSDDNVATHPANRGGSQTAAQQPATSRILALTGILQTTLEINELMALFAKELGRFIAFDGLVYHFTSLDISIALGQQTGHSCEYRLIVSSEELGDLKLHRDHPFSREEMETAENLLAALLYPLRNALLYQRAVQSAMIDPLTGVKNRSTMKDSLVRAIELSRRQGTELSVLLLDIDHFKTINDRFGHLYGDQALKAVAQCADRSIRDSDALFRYGGEEFVILLSGTSLEGSLKLAERIRHNIERLHPLPDRDVSVTISIGVAMLQQDDDIDRLLERADTALYQAKSQGRNRVVAG
ncbi:MAG TPA: GGDEF domain-containing protein [Sedimenticola thiotaurini]|uniref:diguanylate cyclase n=1 Tax=Sedimenticola thiotaurini TaxID=1543721 RepID=A0A831W659_9GAMM|nr:GGDEF domain-containing protein [Sedimenticola thiotaurini]